MADPNDLTNKVAMITGAAQGIGKGIAQTLADHGAAVVLTDIDDSRVRSAAEEIRTRGGRALAVLQDVSDTTSTATVIDTAVQEFGGFDILVNNAGVAAQMPFDKITEEDWDRLNSINQRGLFFASQAAGIHFKQQGSGKIVNISSFAGHQAVEEYLTYNATKAAAIMITQVMALELGPFNVNVNAVCPGIVKTAIWDTLDPAVWRKNEQSIPLRRGQTPEDIGEAVAFLASERARNITGAILPVTGGLAMF
ncbi:SDR family NAD(P)-dependent oxidoreductase [Streptomyces sp. MBT62]|uniref:SDR family NAD(P)-dependent oxidoreductase n=1 Tax=Streptomyces sp. MBT62 TaxID=2800410 RepID=UPI00190BE07D|nr:SDR family NAD(P)-dependent oxidoreductase [Streptomyces sp. MBT62]MBK3566287.1 SDR family oxidoreductase [Streptomyces sp. MBT62]